MKNMVIKQVPYNSKEYFATVELRERLLRTPLGLSFSDSEIREESNEFHIAAFEKDTLLGCLVLIPIDEKTFKMRQLIIDEPCQGKSIGTNLVRFAEDFTVQKGASTLFAHARKTAIPFYEKLGYSVVSEEFIEVTIPHFKIEKNLSP